MPDVGRQEAVESLEVTGGPPHVGSMDPQAFPEKGPERGGLERNLAVHPLERRAENLRGLSFWEQPGPKEPPRKVCPKTAGLGTIRLSCCHRGPRVNLHLSLLLGLEAEGPGLAWQGCSRKLLPRSPVIPEE